MKSQIEDLKGMRRGTVRIACSQALALDFLPREIGEFRKRHPLVSFDVKVLDHEQAMAALAAYEVDLVLVFRPPFLANFQPLMTLEQRIVAVMAAGSSAGEPRAPCGCATARPIRWRWPSAASAAGNCWRRSGPQPDLVSDRGGVQLVRVAARPGDAGQSDLVSDPRSAPCRTATSWASSRATSTTATCRAPISFSANCESRNLPIPAAIFAERLVRVLEAMRGDNRSVAAAAAIAEAGCIRGTGGPEIRRQPECHDVNQQSQA